MNFTVTPVPPEIAESVRRDLRSPQYGHPAFVEPASGYGPCRTCLRTFRSIAEHRILFTFNPVRQDEGIPQPGPVFIHEAACEPFAGAGFPSDLRTIPLLLEGLGQRSLMVKRVPIESATDIEETIAGLFLDPSVEVIHVRNAEAGCYVARVERAPDVSTRPTA